MLHQCCLVACTIQLLRAMRDAEKFSSRLLRKRVLDICCSSLPSNIFPWAPSAEYNARCPYMSPVSWQHSATGPLCNLHTSPYIHKNKNLAQDQPDGRKSSVDAHGVSSCLGCSRILRHLISFLTSSQDFRSRKNYGTRNSSHTSEQGQSRLYTQFMRVKLIIRHVNPCCTNAVLLLVQFSCSERWGMQKLLRAMRDAEKISSRLLRKRVLDICCSSLPSNIFPWAPSAVYNARCPYMSPVSWQHSATGPLYNPHTSSFIHKKKDLAQDQPDGKKSSVDAHGVSSCLGCSRILRHLISFFNIITGLPK